MGKSDFLWRTKKITSRDFANNKNYRDALSDLPGEFGSHSIRVTPSRSGTVTASVQFMDEDKVVAYYRLTVDRGYLVPNAEIKLEDSVRGEVTEFNRMVASRLGLPLKRGRG